MKEQIVLALSLKRNVCMLFRMPKKRSKAITCMFGIRFLTMIWIIIGHMFAFVAVRCSKEILKLLIFLNFLIH